jgi:hypothetical protein
MLEAASFVLYFNQWDNFVIGNWDKSGNFIFHFGWVPCNEELDIFWVVVTLDLYLDRSMYCPVLIMCFSSDVQVLANHVLSTQCLEHVQYNWVIQSNFTQLKVGEMCIWTKSLGFKDIEHEEQNAEPFLFKGVHSKTISNLYSMEVHHQDLIPLDNKKKRFSGY